MLQGIWDISSPTRDWTQTPTSPLLLPPHPLPQWDFVVLPTGPPGKSPRRGTQQEEERLQFFPGKNSAKEKNHGLFFFFLTFCLLQPSQLFKNVLLPLLGGGLPWFAIVSDPELQFSADCWEISLSWKNIWLSFFSGQHSFEGSSWSLYWEQAVRTHGWKQGNLSERRSSNWNPDEEYHVSDTGGSSSLWRWWLS